MTVIVYRKDHRRRPVCFGRFPIRDIQADIPSAWCQRCGREVFDPGQERCIWCRKAKGEMEDE